MKKTTIYIISTSTLMLGAGMLWALITYYKDSQDDKEQAHVGASIYQIEQESGEPIQPIPLTINLDEHKVALGEALFNEPMLSHDNTISCASCHNLATGGTDHLVHSLGSGGATGDINSPTVFNSGLNFRQFWDGRAATLEDQIDGPTHHPKEMNSNWKEITGKLRKSPDYIATFSKLYPEGITSNTIKDAIATFERSLITPNSRFDKFLRGDKNALTEQEKTGYRLFKEYGCIACHQGANVGGNMFHTLGIMADYFADRGNTTKADLGRFNVTGDKSDLHTFRVPSLRLVVLTPPYFHDGAAKTLEQAIDAMAKYQLGRSISENDRDLIIKFLYTLPGEYKGRPLL